MAVYFNAHSLPGFTNAVLTIGTFDGVHHGHRRILQEVARQAIDAGGESIVITFSPHPRKLLYPNQSLKLITPLEEKLRLITEQGIKHIVVVPFTREFAARSAQDYIKEFLVARFQPRRIIIGYDHHFGHDRTGNIELLKQLAPEYGYDVVEIPPQLVDEAAVSSTRIREALQAGSVADAAQMMDHPYSLKGTVVQGAKLGRTIGYPTANIQPLDPDQLIPGIGIYAVRVKLNGELYGGMLSIGYNPTVTNEKTIHIEVHIFNFSADIYGHELELIFVDYMRAEEKFESLEALKEQLGRDQAHAQLILAS